MNAHVDIKSLQTTEVDPIIGLAAAEATAWKRSNTALCRDWDGAGQRAWERWHTRADALFAATPTTADGLVAMMEAFWAQTVTFREKREIEKPVGERPIEERRLRAIIDAGHRLVAAQSALAK